VKFAVQKQWRELKLRLTDERRLRLQVILTALVPYIVLSIASRGRDAFEFSPHSGKNWQHNDFMEEGIPTAPSSIGIGVCSRLEFLLQINAILKIYEQIAIIQIKLIENETINCIYQ